MTLLMEDGSQHGNCTHSRRSSQSLGPGSLVDSVLPRGEGHTGDHHRCFLGPLHIILQPPAVLGLQCL